MSNKSFPSNLLSWRGQKRFSKHSNYGLSIYGFSNYGDEAIGLIYEPFGIAIFGGAVFGNYFLLSGIYQLRKSKKGKHSHRMNFYNYKITHTAGQQTRREKFDLAVSEWQGLTEPQKEVYNQKARYKRYSGYNLFIKKFLSS